jgi:PPOX class probable F420-dependent enzyme
MSTLVPDTHRDLLDGPTYVTLATVMPNGQPQLSIVWGNYDGTYVKVNTARGRQKEKNMLARPMVTVLALDPENPFRWIEVRGEVELTEKGAVEHIHELSRLYTKQDYYGGFQDPTLEEKETRVLGKIKPTRVVTSD